MDTPDNPRRREEIKKVTEQAAEWFTLLEEGAGTAEERAQFSQWITESPLHVKAFLNVTAVDRIIETADIEWHPDSAADKPQEPATNVLPLRDAQHGAAILVSAESIRPARRPLMRSLAVAATIMLAVAGGWLVFDFGNKQRYTTGIGEQRSVELIDGSVVHLNAKSRLEVRFSENARELHLLDGEALFRVQHQASRPFRVYVNETVVQAIGTQFDVNRRHSFTTVSVIEGVVQISSGSGPARRLAAGESVNIATSGSIGQRAPVTAAQVTAWRERRLVFEEDTLADIAAEFNRYNRSPQLRIEGGASQRRYAAVFDADDPESLLQFLKKERDLAFDTRDGEIVIRAR